MNNRIAISLQESLRTFIRGVIVALLVGTFSFISTFGQAPGVEFPLTLEDNDGILSDEYKKRRAALLETMHPNSVSIFFSADIRNRQNDVDYEYRQDNNLFYFSGYPEAKSMLVLTKMMKTTTKANVAVTSMEVAEDFVDSSRSESDVLYDTTVVTQEVLFVPPRNPQQEVWTGTLFGAKRAEILYGVTARPSTEFRSFIDSVLALADTLFITTYPTPLVTEPLFGKPLITQSSIKKSLREAFPDVALKSQLKRIRSMREAKSVEEIVLLQKAVEISMEGHIASMKAAKSGMKEYQLEAVMESTFKHLGAEDVGYPSIVGSGGNACILHYISNRRTVQDGDLVLMDCGAEYHGYTADITRTFPINGKFTEEQKILYDVVLEAQDSAIAQCQIGNVWRSTHLAARTVIKKRLFELGIIRDTLEYPQDYRYYFMHGTSHHLGLDVHDLGRGNIPFRPGMVLTVEPGIYIPAGSPCDQKWWNIGIRIEDDIVIVAQEEADEFGNTHRNMSKKLARTTDDIERLMNDED